VELPRDRDASFDPQIVPKHARSFDGFDDQILALYAGGMTTREIQRPLLDRGPDRAAKPRRAGHPVVCADGVTGFPDAIEAVFPQAVNQTCIEPDLHRPPVRQSLRYLSYQERKRCAAELRRIYTAPDADQARQVLDELTLEWADSRTRTAALQVWHRAWQRAIPFLAFPEEIRRIV